MNTNQLKKFAQEARIKLIDQVSSRLNYVLNTDSAELREKSAAISNLREALKNVTKEQLIDKVAYTWFNRFVALRFMDVNNYQPIGVRVVSTLEGFTTPEILDEAKRGHIHDEIKVDRRKIGDLLDGRIPSSNAQNEVYKLLLTGVCNHLHKTFPFLFERIDDYTELLLPDDLTSEFSIIQDIRNGMSKEDCEKVEIIGWLYQFYISEKKDEVFASKDKVKKEDIPAATQLFTPRWIVEYMVQNTVGKLWLLNNPTSKLKDHMPYYIESAEKDNDFLKIDSVEEITLLDQACGSGHILVYGFELLTKIYEEQGYNTSEIPQLIINKNLFGFEIDERAAQLSGFALLMKAREYNRRVFRKELKPNILCYKDLKLTEEEIKETFTQLKIELTDEMLFDLKNIQQATNLGSLISPHSDATSIKEVIDKVISSKSSSDVFLRYRLEELEVSLEHLLLLSNKYHCIVDNPPYMGSRKMDDKLKTYLRTNFKNAHQDLYACFISSAKNQLLNKGIASFVTLQGWLFVSSFENFRKWLLDNYMFESLVQIGGNSFPSLNSQVARAVTFTFSNSENEYKNYVKSFDLDNVTNSHSVNKKELFSNYINNNKFTVRDFSIFRTISRHTFLHSVQSSLLNAFINSEPLGSIAKPKQGLATGNNNRFVRFWFETVFDKSTWSKNSLSDKMWFPYNKGGDFNKWFGNSENVVNWQNNGSQIKNFTDSNGKLRSRPQNEQYYFREGVTYSLIGNSEFCARYYPQGFLFDVGGSGFFPDKENLLPLLGLVNSKVGSLILSRLNPTVNFQVGDIENIPVILNESIRKKSSLLVQKNIEISLYELQRSEIQPYFHKVQLINKDFDIIEDLIEDQLHLTVKKLNELYNNEVKINELFLESYNLDNSEINIHKIKTSFFGLHKLSSPKEIEDFRNNGTVLMINDLISFSIGCMFGRYSLDKEGIILANQEETLQDYLLKVEKQELELSFVPDDDNIIPILDDEWFEDDIVGRFYAFLKASFGEQNFEKNLSFVEDSLGKDIRKYFVKDFYKDHIKRYKKRPIYWMFSSPKGSFNVLVYMHRYTPDTLNQVLNGYLNEYREKLKTRIETLDHLMVSGSPSEQNKASKEKDKIQLVLLELQEYERETLYPLATERISIDLDDGVLVNYNKFGDAIAAVAGLNDKKAKEKVKKFDWIDTTMIR